jgi:integrase
MAAIKKFYDTNDIALKWAKIKSYVDKGKGRGGGRKDRPYTIKEISKMLEKADQREKIAILLMCSSGIRVGGIIFTQNKKFGKDRHVFVIRDLY